MDTFAKVDALVKPLFAKLDIKAMARHNAGYRAYAEDPFRHFVLDEKARYVAAVEIIRSFAKTGRVCDLGCFIPYLPLVLALEGYEVSIADKYSLYSSELREAISEVALAHGIRMYDVDLVADDLSEIGKNDFVLLMAVVEHLTGSPRELMLRIHSLLEPSGRLLFEVPNIAEFGKRLKALRGHSILPPYSDYFESAVPFTGHNREMTKAEVGFLLSQTGYAIEQLYCFDGKYPDTFKGRVLQAIKTLAPMRNKGLGIRAVATSAFAANQVS